MSSNNFIAQPHAESVPFEQLRSIVESEFQVEDSFVEYGVPTFHIKLQEDSKKAFLRLVERLEPMGFVPVLRRREEKIVLQAMRKPPTKPSRKIINIVLFFATLATVFLAGYWQSLDVTDAVMFTGAIIAILGSHEMGHKIAADKHGVEATYPYFVPGPPPIGTFGAVIQQKSLPPNREALFDLGSAGPVTGFIVSIIVTLIGVQLSVRVPEAPPGAVPWPYPNPILFEWLFRFAATFFPLGGTGDLILVHPVVFAGWVGMVVTVLNLIPVGMFDGGHIARTFLGERTRSIISYLAIATFLVLGFLVWEAFMMWALIAIFFSFMRHPGPLDDASKVTTGRKLAALGMAVMFFLSFPFLI
ncbi:MAG: site-2 protease family protein [Candidatus Bathyarchaeia archaeon]